MKNAIDEPGGPWTRHGHSVPGLTIDGPGRPNAIARCGGPALCSDCATDVERLRGASAGVTPPTRGGPWYVVWSNQRGMWWRASHSGYTQYIEEAGRYSRDVAEAIIRQATCDGALKHTRTNPYTGVDYESYDEVLVLAPEATSG